MPRLSPKSEAIVVEQAVTVGSLVIIVSGLWQTTAERPFCANISIPMTWVGNVLECGCLVSRVPVLLGSEVTAWCSELIALV